MKKFSNFIIEVKETKVSQQAKSLGLVGDGHGDWYSPQGEFVAKTVNGKLEFFNKGQQLGRKDTPAKVTPSAPQASTLVQQQAQQAQQITPQRIQPGQDQNVPDNGEFLTVIFGRFNPPTKEHKQLFSTAERISLGKEIRVYPSRAHDPKKNPLNPNKKISYLKIMFPNFAEDIVNNPEMKTIFDVLVSANEDGYNNINIVVGSDRQAEVQSLATKYNGKFYEFNEIKVIPTGTFDSEKDAIGISSGMLRRAAAENKFREFKRGMPKEISDADAKKMFNDVRKGMGFTTTMSESFNLWEIAPELDYKNLRENYVRNKIFKLNDVVENMNTGLVGKIIRRGTNYLICVTEEDVMFKSWIKDVREYTEVQMDSPMRDAKHPNTLVGTLGAFKHFAKMTPGAIGSGKQNLQYGGKPYGVDFINKYRKIKEHFYSNV
jgi:hypothetical protein